MPPAPVPWAPRPPLTTPSSTQPCLPPPHQPPSLLSIPSPDPGEMSAPVTTAPSRPSPCATALARAAGACITTACGPWVVLSHSHRGWRARPRPSFWHSGQHSLGLCPSLQEPLRLPCGLFFLCKCPGCWPSPVSPQAHPRSHLLAPVTPALSRPPLGSPHRGGSRIAPGPVTFCLSDLSAPGPSTSTAGARLPGCCTGWA